MNLLVLFPAKSKITRFLIRTLCLGWNQPMNFSTVASRNTSFKEINQKISGKVMMMQKAEEGMIILKSWRAEEIGF